MGRKGVISSHTTLYSRTERKGATQIAARSTAPISDFLGDTSPPPPLPRTLCERTVLSTCWSIRKGGSWGSLYETQPWLFTLFSIKLHQEKVWDVDGNWQWHFLIFLGLRWPIRSYNNYWNIFFDILTLWKPLELEERHFIHVSSSNIGRNRDYETVCWETTHTDKLYNFRFTAIRSCETNPADSLFCQPMRTFGQHISISVTTFIYIKNCVLISKI